MSYTGNTYELAELLVENVHGDELHVSGRYVVIEHTVPEPAAGIVSEFYSLAPEGEDSEEAVVTADPTELLEQIDPETVAAERRREAADEAAEEAERLEERVREEEAQSDG